jgi:uncharacterized membrane protein (Fun14 family)
LFAATQFQPRISNDSVVSSEYGQSRFQTAIPHKSRFNGKLDYEQLSVGSFTGLLSGYIVGKLSRIIAFITLSGLLTLQFLQSRGFISTSDIPLANRAFRWLRDRFNVSEFILEKPSFKISYLLSFGIAALYA